jgi:FtsP/CotA-like multicopper oxidase with cupredoxin domain
VNASEGDTLIVHLRNNLALPGTVAYVPPPALVAPALYSEPVSIVIPGQRGDFVPTWVDGIRGPRTSTSQRVRSFTREAPQQGNADYTFGPLKPGSYLMQSGTHPSVQVQMGLYGVLAVLPQNPGLAYPDPSCKIDCEVTLLYSEIDPALHAAVASGQYGAAPAAPTPMDPDALLPDGWKTSTITYQPKFALVNGRPWTAGTPGLPVGGGNRKVLIRLLNAGLETRVPMVQGQYVSIVAEDGNFLSVSGTGGTCPAPRSQYTVLLPAGKTVDAILTTPATAVDINIPVYDRRLHLSNGGSPTPGGQFAMLTVSATGGNPTPPVPLPACTLTGGP